MQEEALKPPGPDSLFQWVHDLQMENASKLSTANPKKHQAMRSLMFFGVLLKLIEINFDMF